MYNNIVDSHVATITVIVQKSMLQILVTLTLGSLSRAPSISVLIPGLIAYM